MISAFFTAIIAFLEALFGRKPADDALAEDRRVAEAYKEEAKGMARPAKSWQQTIDDL